MLCGVSLRFDWYNKLVLYLIGIKVLKFSFSNLYRNSRNRHQNDIIERLSIIRSFVTKIPLAQ